MGEETLEIEHALIVNVGLQEGEKLLDPLFFHALLVKQVLHSLHRHQIIRIPGNQSESIFDVQQIVA